MGVQKACRKFLTNSAIFRFVTSLSVASPVELAEPVEVIASDVAAIARISAVPEMLKLVCDLTGMGFAAVARVSENTWTACAVEDRIAFGLPPGGQLKIETTLCREARSVRSPIVIDHAAIDPVYRDHHTPRIYGIQSYVSVPIIRPDGKYFGNLCAIDPKPAKVSDAKTMRVFSSLASMIALQLTTDDAYLVGEQQLQESREQGELREQFIAVLGHDLRNPLGAVSATAEILLRRPDQQDQKLGRRLRNSANRMAGLITNVMDFARARLGSGIGVEIRKGADLADALRSVVDESSSAHPEIQIHSSVSVPGPVAADVSRLQQLLSNMIGNAIHHGAEAEPIFVDVHEEDIWLEISVSNAGDPIPEDHLKKIFMPYWRPPTSKPGGGLGLGLYICSEIVKAHGGTFSATSTLAAGTCFTARLPLDGERTSSLS